MSDLRVAVLGAGVMGAAIAAEFLAAGSAVRITTSEVTRPEAAKERTLSWLPAEGRDAADLDWSATPEEACREADLVIESLPESLEVKAQHLARAQRAATAAIFTTNTSSLPVASIAAALPDPTRLVGLHYLNPPPAFAVVELVPTDRTSDEVVRGVTSILEAIGKRPVVVRDVPGFAINRLQFALLREAEDLVAEGITSREEIDRIVRDGLARRWEITGPFTTVALGPPALFARVAANLYPELSVRQAPGEVLAQTTLDGPTRRQLINEREAGLACRPIPLKPPAVEPR